MTNACAPFLSLKFDTLKHGFDQTSDNTYCGHEPRILSVHPCSPLSADSIRTVAYGSVTVGVKLEFAMFKVKVSILNLYWLSRKTRL